MKYNSLNRLSAVASVTITLVITDGDVPMNLANWSPGSPLTTHLVGVRQHNTLCSIIIIRICNNEKASTKHARNKTLN